MAFFTSWIFWVIVAAIVVIMAIIGYLAEGTKLGSKSKNKQNEEKENKEEVEEILVAEETNAPSAWTGEVKKDERHEQVHDVPSVDDWTNIPTDTVAETPAIEKPVEETTELFSEMTPNSTTPSVEPINPGVLENLDAPLTNEEPIETFEEPQMETPVSNETVVTPAPEIQPEQFTTAVPEPVTEIQPEPVQNSETVEPVIESAPIFDAPMPEQPEKLEVLEEENKQETNVDDIWK